MRGQRLLIMTLGVAILVTCSSGDSKSGGETPTASKGTQRDLNERLSEMAKEFGATSFEEMSEEMASAEGKVTHLASKQHVKRRISGEQNAELQTYQGVMGRPGVDFPVLPGIPKTGFSCRQVKSSGYYADMDTNCQVFHICADGRKISFLCPNGTIFRQSHLICDWWWTVDCANSREHYEESAELLANDRKFYQARSDASSKSKAKHHVNRKPGIIRDFAGESATVTSYSTEPVPRNARIQVHSKVTDPSKQLPGSTANPGFSRSSGEVHSRSRMEKSEQRPVNAFNPTYAHSNQKHPQYQESRQGRVLDKTDQHHEDTNYSQNTPLAPRAPEQRQILQLNQFAEIRPPLEGSSRPQQPVITTHRPKISQFSRSRQFEQSVSDGNKPLNTFSQSRQHSQQPVTSQNYQQAQFPPESQTFPENKEVNNDTRSYSHVTFSPSLEIEGQLPAETGSFVSSRGNKLSGVNQAPDRQRISQNRVQQTTPKTYTDLDSSQNITQERSSQVDSVGFQVTDRGITDLPAKQSFPEAITEEVPLDDAGFQDPPSDKEFKDEDLFYLLGTSTENDLIVGTALTESPVKHNDTYTSVFEDDFKNRSGEMSPFGDLGVLKSPSYSGFNNEYVHGGYENKEIRDYTEPKEPVNILDTFKSTTILPSVDYDTDITSSDLSSNFPTRKSHRFYSPITYTTFIPETRTAQNTENSTDEPPDEYVFTRKKASNAHSITSHWNAKGQVTDSPQELLRNIDVSTIRPTRYGPANTPAALVTEPNEVFSVNEESATKKLEPIFVEIIHRGSSEPPVLKTYTVEELENRRDNIGSDLSTDKDELSSSNPETMASRSHILATDEESSTSTESSSPVTLSRGFTPPNELPSLSRVPDDTYSEWSATVLPPKPHITLSRILLPPEIVGVPLDLHGKNKTDNISSHRSSSTYRTMTKSPFFVHTTTINPVTLSRRVQPPFEPVVHFNSGLSIPKITPTVEQDRQQHTIDYANRDTFVRLENFKGDGVQNTATHHLRQEAGIAQDILVTTESSASATDSSSLHVDIQHLTSEPSPVTAFPFKEQKTVTESIQATTPFFNISLHEPATESDIPISLPLKQEPDSSPRYKNRDGFAIPASSGPSTLHSLAVYFSIRNKNEETTVDTLKSFDFDKFIVKGERPTTESVPVESSTIYDLTTDINETDVPVQAPVFLTKPIRDSYSALFPITKEANSPVTELMTSLTNTAEISKERKTSPSLHNALRHELLDKLAEISEMEEKPLHDRKTVSSRKEVLHSDTEDFLQGTDSQDLRELAQIFSRALSAYLENPEGFKKALSEVRPKDPSSVYTDEFETKQFLDTTRSAMSSSTPIPLTTSSTEYSSVTQEDEEVLDFSDVSKVSRRKSKPTTFMPPHSKTIKTEKLKNSFSTSYGNPAIVTSSGRKRVTDTTSNSSSRDSVDDADLKLLEEGLQNAQSTYYTSSKQQVPKSASTVSPNMFESVAVTEDHGEDYTLPFGTKQYDGPGYGPQAGEIKFAPTAGGVNDPSRPRYGGFQNNSVVTSKEVSAKITETQGSVDATTLVPESKHRARFTVKPFSVTPDVETTSTEEVPGEFGNIFNTFIPQELNNLAVAGTSETPPALLSNENILKERAYVHNLQPNSNEAALGANIGSFTSLPASQPPNLDIQERKWSSLGNVVDALTINHELSESEVKRTSNVAKQITPSVTTRQGLSPTSQPVYRARHRTTSKSNTSELSVAAEDSVKQLSSTPYDCGKVTNVGSSVFPQQQKNEHSQLKYQSQFTSSGAGLSGNSDPIRENKPLRNAARTFYSEEIKPPLPHSASLIHISVSRKSKVGISNSTSNIPDSSRKISMITPATNIPFNIQATTTTQTYFPILKSKSISFQPKSGTDNYSQLSRNSQEPDVSKHGLESLSKISVPSEQFVPVPFTEISPTDDTVTASWKQETHQSQQVDSDVELLRVQSVTTVPVTNSILPSKGNIPTRGTINTTIKTNSYNEGVGVDILKDHFVVPSTSMSTLALLDGSSPVIATSGSYALSRKKEPTEKLQSFNKELVSGESKNASNSQHFVRINTVVSSARRHNSSNSPAVQAIRKEFSSNHSLMATSKTSQGKDVRMGNVTADQLQALEDLQAMLFSANTTAAKDGSMFGNLNISSTLSLISSMKETMMNSTVRRLVLLLVNSLKENTPQETRSQLIDALLRMPINHKPSDVQQDSVSALLKKGAEPLSEKVNGKNNSVGVPPSTLLETSQISMNTQPDFQNKHLIVTPAAATNIHSEGENNSQSATSKAPEVRLAARSKGRRLVKIRVTTERPWIIPSTTSSSETYPQPDNFAKEGDSLPQSDTRAVELLQSLYSLATRWG